RRAAEPRSRFAQPPKQGRIGQAGDLAGLSPCTGLAQRHAEAAVGKGQPQQCRRVLDLPRPRKGSALPRRRFHVKIRRKARAHFRPVIQNLRANLHPKLESHRDSWCPELNLAHMTPTLSPPEGAEGARSPCPPHMRSRYVTARHDI